MQAVFTEFESNSNWVEGTIGNLKFQAKLFDEGSKFGINNGRVSKLSIYNDNLRHKIGFHNACVINYDRGWDIEVKDGYNEHYNAVMDLLENAPKRFEYLK